MRNFLKFNPRNPLVQFQAIWHFSSGTLHFILSNSLILPLLTDIPSSWVNSNNILTHTAASPVPASLSLINQFLGKSFACLLWPEAFFEVSWMQMNSLKYFECLGRVASLLKILCDRGLSIQCACLPVFHLYHSWRLEITLLCSPEHSHPALCPSLGKYVASTLSEGLLYLPVLLHLLLLQFLLIIIILTLLLLLLLLLLLPIINILCFLLIFIFFLLLLLFLLLSLLCGGSFLAWLPTIWPGKIPFFLIGAWCLLSVPPTDPYPKIIWHMCHHALSNPI